MFNIYWNSKINFIFTVRIWRRMCSQLTHCAWRLPNAQCPIIFRNNNNRKNVNIFGTFVQWFCSIFQYLGKFEFFWKCNRINLFVSISWISNENVDSKFHTMKRPKTVFFLNVCFMCVHVDTCLASSSFVHCINAI